MHLKKDTDVCVGNKSSSYVKRICKIARMVVLHVEYVKEKRYSASPPHFGISRLILHSGPQGMTPVVSKPLASVIQTKQNRQN